MRPKARGSQVEMAGLPSGESMKRPSMKTTGLTVEAHLRATIVVAAEEAIPIALSMRALASFRRRKP